MSIRSHPFLPVLASGQKDTLEKYTHGVADLKLDIHTEPDSGSNMGWVPPVHTSLCARIKLQTVRTYVSTLSIPNRTHSSE